ncbi:Uncharacterised protein [Mycobacterium tuberculosis]|uniref:Uncharacterized protein n=1 Tax=Mycobacterium tuberculosis TaxID=1773 RepID=A0A0T7LE70_MYCTX|nr:Uncharacterised protein [Mycobacterium tuberculosis]CFE46401.1 Uncharacterised protein [Mycobacterium tuberculosis]CKR53182.1 Uncharacterised protein [Mycobacterium tuberculosis]COU93919.1 Uncharacterised protein [Mycobacterium tuberculosis]COX11047.1 Uncharacterised protein [Mycobacterium tuberculosis]
MASDPRVVSERIGQLANVGTRRLAHFGDRIDKRNLGRQKGIGGYLDQLRGLQIGHQKRHARCQQRRVQLADGYLGARRIILYPKDDTVGVEGVVHREALAQEFRIPGNFHVDSPGCQCTGPMSQFGCGAHWDCRLADQNRRPDQTRHQRIDDGVDMPQVGAIFAYLLRRADPQEMHVGEIGRHVVVGGEPQAAGSQVISQQLSQAGFVERNVTPGELGDLTGIDIDPDDLVSQLRHTDGVGGTQIPSAEDAASHTTVCRWLR